jgi:hypothetical protein
MKAVNCYIMVWPVLNRRAFQPSRARAVLIAWDSGGIMYQSTPGAGRDEALAMAAKFLKSKKGARFRITATPTSDS